MYKFYFRLDWLCPALLAFFAGLMYLSSRYFAISAEELDGAVFVAIQLAVVGGFARFFYDGATLSQQAKAGLTMLFFATALGSLGNLLSPAHALLDGFKFFFSWVQMAVMYTGAASATLSLYRLEKLPKEAPAAPGQAAQAPQKSQESAAQALPETVPDSDSSPAEPLPIESEAAEPNQQDSEAQTVHTAKSEKAT